MFVGTEAGASEIGGIHVETPVMAGEGVERGVIHASKQGGFKGFALIVLDVDGPGLFAARVELVAHGGQLHVEVVVVVWHADVVALHVVGVLLHESDLDEEVAAVGFGDVVFDLLDIVVEGEPFLQTRLVAMQELHPHLDVLGGAADVETYRLTRMGGAFVVLEPAHGGVRQLLGVVTEDAELRSVLGQRVVEALQLDVVFAWLQRGLARIEAGVIVHRDLVLVDQGLVLHLVLGAVDAEVGEEGQDLLIAENLAVEVGLLFDRLEVIDATEVVETVDLA